MASLSALLPTGAPSLIFGADNLTVEQESPSIRPEAMTDQPPPIMKDFDMVDVREDGGHPMSRLDDE